MKKEIIIKTQKGNIVLRTIEKKDVQIIRRWKNINKDRFFCQEEISEEAQQEWFERYMYTEEDYIFIIEELDYNSQIGCLGYRINKKNQIDIYNVIRGNQSKNKVSMHEAMQILLIYLKKKHLNHEIVCEVLKNNPARCWYQKCGFVYKEKYLNYYVLKSDFIVENIKIYVEENI